MLYKLQLSFISFHFKLYFAFTFSPLTSRFINITDIRFHKSTSLNMVLIPEVEYKKGYSSDSLKSHSHEISYIDAHFPKVGIGTHAGYLLTDWNRKNILEPCITFQHLW